jgi:hypothetical protein
MKWFSPICNSDISLEQAGLFRNFLCALTLDGRFLSGGSAWPAVHLQSAR